MKIRDRRQADSWTAAESQIKLRTIEDAVPKFEEMAGEYGATPEE
jgi:hypothetical protein